MRGGSDVCRYPAFVHLDVSDKDYAGGLGRLHLQPSVRNIQTAVEPLFDEAGLSQYSLLTISQLLVKHTVASLNVKGMALQPTSILECTEPAVVTSARHFAWHFLRRLSHLRLRDFNIRNAKQKVVVAFLGQIDGGAAGGAVFFETERAFLRRSAEVRAPW